MRNTRLVAFVVVSAMLAPAAGWASVVSFQREFKVDGREGANATLPTEPGGTPSVVFADLSDGVEIKMDLGGMYDADKSDDYKKYYVRNWLFNYSGNADDLKFEYLPWKKDDTEKKSHKYTQAATVQTGSFSAPEPFSDGGVKRTGDVNVVGSGTDVTGDLGTFNILFEFAFPNSSKTYEFDVGEYVTYKVTSLSGNDVPRAADFMFPSDGGTAMSAVGIWPSCENYEVWYTADAPNVVPEPGTMALLGTGLLGMGAWVRRQRRAGEPEKGEQG